MSGNTNQNKINSTQSIKHRQCDLSVNCNKSLFCIHGNYR